VQTYGQWRDRRRERLAEQAEAQHRQEAAPGNLAGDRSTKLEDPRWSAVQALVISAFVTVGVLASLAGLLVMLSRTSSGPESSLSLVFVSAAVVLILVVCTLTIVLKRLRLTNSEEPMGLPRGSIRAVIALLLILLFFIAAIFLFNSTLLGGERDANRSIQGMDSTRYSAIPTDQIVSATPRTVGTQTVYDVVLYPGSSGTPTSDDLAKQLVTTLATLVTAVAAFYFGANSVRGAAKDAVSSSGGQVPVRDLPGSGGGTSAQAGGAAGAGASGTADENGDSEPGGADPGKAGKDGPSGPVAAQAADGDTSSEEHSGTGGEGAMSDFDRRPGDEIEPRGEGDLDPFPDPELAEEDVTVDDIHERAPLELGPTGGPSQ
jgi:hypothetical protein